MERAAVEPVVKRICAEVLEIEQDELLLENEDDSLAEKFGLNSVDALEVLMQIENAFDIEIDDEDLSVELIRSVDTLTDYVLAVLSGETPCVPSAPEASDESSADSEETGEEATAAESPAPAGP